MTFEPVVSGSLETGTSVPAGQTVSVSAADQSKSSRTETMERGKATTSASADAAVTANGSTAAVSQKDGGDARAAHLSVEQAQNNPVPGANPDSGQTPAGPASGADQTPGNDSDDPPTSPGEAEPAPTAVPVIPAPTAPPPAVTDAPAVPEVPQEISVTISVDCITAFELGNDVALAITSNGWLVSSLSLTLPAGANVYDALLATGLVVQARTSGFGVYISSIQSLAEFAEGSESGWVYFVNGVFANVSSDRYVLQNGDVISWRYTVSKGDL